MKILILILALMLAVFQTISAAETVEEGELAYYVLCTPEGDVNVREHARIRSEATGGLTFAKEVLSDGKTKNGFIHVVDLAAEDTTGWVSAGYLVEDKPIACKWIGYAVGLGKILARKCINGKVIKRIEPGSEVIIYAYSEEWCVTEYGFIRTEFLEIPQQEGDYRRGDI